MEIYHSQSILHCSEVRIFKVYVLLINVCLEYYSMRGRSSSLSRGEAETVDTSSWFLELHAKMAMERRKKPTFVEVGVGMECRVLVQNSSFIS